MKLKKFEMEKWFIKTGDAKYNFNESGIPDFKINRLLKKTKVKKSILENVFLGNNNTLGSLNFREKISSLYKNVKSKDLLITTGTSESLYILFNLILNKKSKILILHPAFPMLYLVPQSLGAKVYFLDVLKNKNKEELVKNLCLKIKTVKPDLLIINTPHNPTGFAFNDGELKEIIGTSKKNGVKILFDEHYRFLPINKEENILSSGYDLAIKSYKDIYAVGSIIKCLGIVGIRIGWIIANKKTLEDIRNYKDYTTHCVPLISEKIASIAIDGMENITSDTKKKIGTNWKILKGSNLVKNKKIGLNYELEGGCVYFPKINKFDSQKLAEILYKKYNTSIMPGKNFGYPNYIRINMAQKIGDFINLLERMDEIIK